MAVTVSVIPHVGEKIQCFPLFRFALASSFKAKILVKHFEAMKSPFKKERRIMDKEPFYVCVQHCKQTVH